MAVTAAQVQAMSPSLASVPDATVDVFIADAVTELSSNAWGDRLDLATRLLAAHKVTVSYVRAGGTGAIVSESVGGVSRSYSSPPSVGGSADPMVTTSFGQEFRRLQRVTFAGLTFQVMNHG